MQNLKCWSTFSFSKQEDDGNSAICQRDCDGLDESFIQARRRKRRSLELVFMTDLGKIFFILHFHGVVAGGSSVPAVLGDDGVIAYQNEGTSQNTNDSNDKRREISGRISIAAIAKRWRWWKDDVTPLRTIYAANL
ncbi:hypothetical protein IC582_012429 [Cucumis melo]